MNKTFIRSILSDGHIECSHYDKNGRRYSHNIASHLYNSLSVIETDNRFGYMAYARKNGFNIVDCFVGNHPKKILLKG